MFFLFIFKQYILLSHNLFVIIIKLNKETAKYKTINEFHLHLYQNKSFYLFNFNKKIHHMMVPFRSLPSKK